MGNLHHTSPSAFSARSTFLFCSTASLQQDGLECGFTQYWYVSALSQCAVHALTCPGGIKTGPVSGDPPAVSDETKKAVLENSQQEATGQSAPGQDGGDQEAPKKEKTAKESETPNDGTGSEESRQP